jgi:hypothetical protein
MASVMSYETASAWADAFAAANFNALGIGSGIISTATAVANGGVDVMADLSFITVTSTFSPTAAAGAALDFYLIPLLHDGSTYAEAANGTGASQPTATNYVGRIIFQVASAAHVGMLRGIVIPNGTFKWYVINNTGVALPSSATNMTCQYRSYSYSFS